MKHLKKLNLPASNTTGSSANLPHGTAPTAPVNGDLWSTTVAFFGRVNGVTHQFLAVISGVLNIAGAIIATGKIQAASISMNRVSNVNTHINWYNDATHKVWMEYMSQPSQAVNGVTPSTGTLVTSWALRSYVENVAGYGWVWESATGPGNLTPTTKFEIRSSDGSFKSFGNGMVAGTMTATTLAGKLSVPAATGGTSNMNIAAGTAVATPVTGDMWNDGTNLYFRTGGVTYNLTSPPASPAVWA